MEAAAIKVEGKRYINSWRNGDNKGQGNPLALWLLKIMIMISLLVCTAGETSTERISVFLIKYVYGAVDVNPPVTSKW